MVLPLQSFALSDLDSGTDTSSTGILAKRPLLIYNGFRGNTMGADVHRDANSAQDPLHHTHVIRNNETWTMAREYYDNGGPPNVAIAVA